MSVSQRREPAADEQRREEQQGRKSANRIIGEAGGALHHRVFL